MNEDLIRELKNTIKELKIEIIEKEEKLNLLIKQYQELKNIEQEDMDK